MPLQTRWAADHHTVRLVPAAERRHGGGRVRRLLDATFAPEWEAAALAAEHESFGRRGLAGSDRSLRRTLGYPKRFGGG